MDSLQKNINTSALVQQIQPDQWIICRGNPNAMEKYFTTKVGMLSHLKVLPAGVNDTLCMFVDYKFLHYLL